MIVFERWLFSSNWYVVLVCWCCCRSLLGLHHVRSSSVRVWLVPWAGRWWQAASEGLHLATVTVRRWVRLVLTGVVYWAHFRLCEAVVNTRLVNPRVYFRCLMLCWFCCYAQFTAFRVSVMHASSYYKGQNTQSWHWWQRQYVIK